MIISKKRGLTSCSWVFALARATAACAFGSPQALTHPSATGRSHFLPLAVDHQTEKRSKVSQLKPLFSCQNLDTRSFSSCARTEEEEIMTEDALAICNEAIHAVNPYTAVRKHLVLSSDTNQLCVGDSKKYDLNEFSNIVVVAFGKASSAMATAVIEQLTKTKDATNDNDKHPAIQGIVIVKDDHGTGKERRFLEHHNVLFREAGHPVPDERSASSAQEVMDMVSNTADAKTLVVCCISGGGSALFCLPQKDLSLEDLQKTNSVLLESGLSISEINVIRKRLENGKGGRLAAASYPSSIISLVLSDVLGDPLDLIASGPTVPDTSTYQDAWRLVEQNNLQEKLPMTVVQRLQDGVDGKSPDSPSANDPIFKENKSETIIVGNNELAVEAAAGEAMRRGYNTRILGTRIEGEAKHVANVYASMAQYLCLQRDISSCSEHYALAKLPAALIGGGETTVSIPADSDGKGGRNQELALAASLKFQELNLRNVVLASVGTDGTDGPTDAAGAVVDGGTACRLEGSAEDSLRKHDAYNFLDQPEPDGHSPLIRTGPTGTNVADVCVTLIR